MNLRLTGKNQVVTRYKFSIFGVFLAILLVALLLASFRYYSELKSFELSEYRKLENQSSELNQRLKQAINSVQSIQRYANYSLSLPQNTSPVMPPLTQDGERYFLAQKKRDIIEHRQQLSVNITGVGDISRLDDKLTQELAMAHSLTPAFVNAQSNNDVANWFYYVSINEFVGIFPWIGRKNWQYSPALINNDHMQKIAQSAYFSKQYFWSAPYIGSSAKSLYSLVGAGVFRQEEFVGAVVINVDLARLHDLLSMDENDKHSYILFNDQDNVLLSKKNGSPAFNSIGQWQSVIPEAMKDLSFQKLSTKAASFQQNGWLVQQNLLPSANWKLIRYQPYDEFSEPVVRRFMWLFVLLFTGQFGLLTVIYFVTRKTFIKPTQAFINHIAYSAKGDHGKIPAPEGWRHWFDIVGDIFSQNRSLFQQLKDQNDILDMRVNEKTQALVEKSQQHQHDYAILRSVMNAIPDYLIFNDTQGKVIGCNLAFERFVDLSEVQILGQEAGKLIDNELGKALLDCAKGDSKSGNHHGIFNVIETVTNTYEIFSSDFFNQDLEALGTIVIIRDVTEQYAINADLEKAKEQAEQANQAKSQFLANMSHEIRTPINAIQGMHSLLASTQLTNQQNLHIHNAQEASDSLLHLVDELLDLAKIESGKMNIVKEVCNLDQLVNRALKLNSEFIEKKSLQIKVNIDPFVPEWVDTDDMRLVQVLSNLLNNATKFTEQGVIELSLVVIAKSAGDTLVKFTVKDSGIGIAKDKQKRLFEAFMQADESMTREYGGSGLGLSICQRIINLLGGEITIVSDENKGAEFSFVLPFRVCAKENRIGVSSFANIASVDVKFSSSFTDLLSNLGYHHQEFSSIPAINFGEKGQPCFIFCTSDLVNKSVCLQLLETLFHKDNKDKPILAIVAPTHNEQSVQAFNLLDSYQLPYVICESPLYRHCLFQLHDKLRRLKEITVPSDILEEGSGKANVDNETEVEENLSGVSILLVEDNLVNQLVAKELLKAMSANVIVAENGQVGLDLLEQHNVDVVLMDIQMPVMDGLTATKHIRSQSKYAQLPIIAMTAHARREDKEKSLAAGMNLHIAKPVKRELLLASILSELGKAKN